ncbi:MAG: efflux RND transporter periplasmic adaptor subunit [Prosthecochloris sp.]|uniref:Efflux transporter, RND family, MFP subunit n=1 Tax=Prosthecochloris aestuarii (strain DSM 271 / SK 413) TaxID=290512 RepID=B4S851_PROA2|nr:MULTISPECIES: efflux RND transporter periplasmic adaptor subunit [Prosthecochloris]ACF46238.1 efflux transporter, RND family, MFP subunit [Prosthecochloris aestuarii DSM 271]MCW8798997.1 efflux RND transporter periplasmic adaptor subunit [Prosthecochloris sp.]
MKLSTTQKIVAGVTVVVIAILFILMMPAPLPVDTEIVRRGVLTVRLEGEGRSRVKERFTISSPVNGRLERILLDEGDSVTSNAVVARITPPSLNTREYTRAEAAMRSSEAALGAAGARERQVKVDLEQARRKYDRYTVLFEQGAVSKEEYEEVKATRDMLAKEYSAATMTTRSSRFDVDAARAVVDSALEGSFFEVRSPRDGLVLKILEKSERIIAAGTPLVEIGDAHDIELVIDVLSSDAVKVAPGMQVVIEEWGGGSALQGRVRFIEPAAVTKISSLGIEEKRVNIIIDLDEPERRLGDNYRVQADIVLWRGDNVLQVPVSSLFRGDEDWEVFTVRRGRAIVQPVTIGRRGAYEAEVIDGVREGDLVVVHPTNDLEDGMRVKTLKGR